MDEDGLFPTGDHYMPAEMKLIFLGKFSGLQGMVENLIEVKLHSDPEIFDGLGPNYFDRLSDAQRKTWLRAIATSRMNSALGDRLQTVYSELADLRNVIAHAPHNLRFESDRVQRGARKFNSEAIPDDDQLRLAHLRIDWISSWVIWLTSRVGTISKTYDGTNWVDYAPPRPSESLP